MKNLAPEIPRFRLIIEGKFDRAPALIDVRSFLNQLTAMLRMTVVHGPLVMRQAEQMDPKYQGIEGLVIWAESGCTIYTWELHDFFTIDLHSCRRFDPELAVQFTRQFFQADAIEWSEIDPYDDLYSDMKRAGFEPWRPEERPQ